MLNLFYRIAPRNWRMGRVRINIGLMYNINNKEDKSFLRVKTKKKPYLLDNILLMTTSNLILNSLPTTKSTSLFEEVCLLNLSSILQQYCPVCLVKDQLLEKSNQLKSFHFISFVKKMRHQNLNSYYILLVLIWFLAFRCLFRNLYIEITKNTIIFFNLLY